MDETVNKTVDPNPWRDRKDFPNWRETRLIPMAILFLLSCLSFPLSAVRFAPFLLAPFLVGGMGWLTWKRRGGLWLTLIFAAILAFVPVWGASLGFLILAASVGVFSGTYLFTVQGRPYLPVAGAAIAFGVSFAITQKPMTAALSLVLLPAVFLLGLAVLFRERRLASIAVATGGMALSLGALTIWYVVHRQGAWNASSVLTIANSWKASFKTFLTEQYETARLMLPSSAGGETTATMFEQMFTSETLQTYADSIFNLIPAILIVICEIPAFLAQKLLTCSYTTNRLDRVVGLESEAFMVGVPTAIFWLTVFLLSFFGTPTTNLFFAVTENVRYLLLPVVIVAGIGSMKQWYLRANAGSRAFVWVAGIALLCCSPSTVFSLLGLFGAYETVMRAVRRALIQKIEGQFPPDDNDNDNANDGNDE